MTLIFGLVSAIFLFPTASATNDHQSRTIEVNHNGRNHRQTPNEDAEEGCAIDNGSSSPCCGQDTAAVVDNGIALWHNANGDPNQARICPSDRPRCVGYQYNGQFGECQPGYSKQCAVSFGESTACCGQEGAGDSTSEFTWQAVGGGVKAEFVCSSDKPLCVNYVLHESYGTCQTSGDCDSNHGEGAGGNECPADKAECRVYSDSGHERRHCVDPASAEETSSSVHTSAADNSGCTADDVQAKFTSGTMKGMENNMINDCPGALAVGTSCTPACNTGLVAFGAILCAAQGAPSSTAECKAACTLTPPSNGGLGNCPNSMQIQGGTQCQYSCEPQYHPTGKTECFAGASSTWETDVTVAAHENAKNQEAHVNRGGMEAPLLQEAQCVLDPLISQALGKDGTTDIAFKRVSDMSVEATNDMNKVWASGADVFTFLGSFDTECYYVLPDSGDGSTPATEVQMTIKVARPVTINVCLLDGNTQRTAGFMRWPDTPIDGGSSETGWWRDQKAHGPIIDSSGTSHGGGMVFRKNFNEEEIKLPGNDYALNYLVFVCPQDNSHCSAAAVGDVFPMYAQAPNMNRNGGCDGELIPGASCSPLCHEGYVATGSITCTNSGLKSTARCISASEVTEKCSISVPQGGKFACEAHLVVEDKLKEDMSAESGAVADAHPDRECHKNTATCHHDGQLEVGESCVPACDAGYEVSGEFNCYVADGGALATTLASCQDSSSLLETSNKKLMRTAAAP